MGTTMHERYKMTSQLPSFLIKVVFQVYAWKYTLRGWKSVKIPPFSIPRNFPCVYMTDEGIVVIGGTQHEPPKPPCHFSSEVLDHNDPEKGWSLIEHKVTEKSSCEKAYLCYRQQRVQIKCK